MASAVADKRQRGWTSWRLLKVLLLVGGYGFVIGPVLPVLYQSVNRAKFFPAEFEGFTFSWFTALLSDSDLMDGFATSAKVAGAATILALMIGGSAAFAIVRGGKWLRGSTVTSILMGPIVVPQIVIGLAILQLANQLQLSLGLAGLIVAHAVFVVPFVIRLIAAALQAQGGEFEYTAMSLGAKPLRVLVTVTLPMLRQGIIASAVFAFTLSFVNVPLSLFIAPATDRPLPIVVYQVMTTNLSPLLAALSVALIVILVAVAAIIEKVLRVRLFQ